MHIQVTEERVGRPVRQDTVLLDSEASQAGSGKMRREKSYHRGSASVKATNLADEDTVVVHSLLDLLLLG